MKEFVTALLSACLKANNIARCCRDEPELLQLLTQEKGSGEKNDKFEHDFKTLADVLIQESVRFQLSKYSQELGLRIFGEESNEFTNSLGNKIVLQLNDKKEDTQKLLLHVLNGNETVSGLLAEEVHKNVVLPNHLLEEFDQLDEAGTGGGNVSDFGIWIDPIDGTSQYIKGKEELRDGYPVQGLQVAKVLIGVYRISTGVPVMGVVGSPFSEREITFGCEVKGNPFFIPKRFQASLSEETCRKPVIVIGSSEDKQVVDKLSSTFQIMKAGGAGHKMMMVCDNQADIYINSSPTVYVWDTCAPHALLTSIGGGVKTFHGFQDIFYNQSGAVQHNKGIVAYRERRHLQLLKSALA